MSGARIKGSDLTAEELHELALHYFAQTLARTTRAGIYVSGNREISVTIALGLRSTHDLVDAVKVVAERHEDTTLSVRGDLPPRGGAP